MTGFMQGKRGLIMGVANNHSIAWGISKALAAQGAELAFTFQGEALGKRVKPLAEQVGQGSGQGQFRIVLQLDDIGREVEFVLPRGIDSTPKQRSALKLVGGVTAVNAL